MMQLSCSRLALILQGELRLNSMPPLAGLHQPTGAMSVGGSTVRPGDVLWLGDHQAMAMQLSNLAQASGVVSSCRLPTWPGKFLILVDDLGAAARRLREWGECAFQGTRVHYCATDQRSNWTVLAKRLLEETPGPGLSFPSPRNELDSQLQACNGLLSGGYQFVSAKISESRRELAGSLLSQEAIAIITAPESESSRPRTKWMLRFTHRSKRSCTIERIRIPCSTRRFTSASLLAGAASVAEIDGEKMILRGWSLADAAAALAVAQAAGHHPAEILRRWNRFDDAPRRAA